MRVPRRADKVLLLNREGCNVAEIAQALRITPESVCEVMERFSRAVSETAAWKISSQLPTWDMVPESTFYREVRRYCLTAPVWEQVIRYFTKPDERWDLTLVSQRVYGNRDEYLTIMAAAGLDRLDQELTERELVLPSVERLAMIKARTGYVATQPAPVR